MTRQSIELRRWKMTRQSIELRRMKKELGRLLN